MMIPAGILVASRLSCRGTRRSISGMVDVHHVVLPGENVARFTEGVGVETRRGPLFYLPVVLSDSLPVVHVPVRAAATWFRTADAAARCRCRTPYAPHACARHVAVGARHRLVFSLSAASRISTSFPIVPGVGLSEGC